MAKTREYIGSIVLTPQGRKVVWPEGIECHSMCRIEVDYDNEAGTATMRITEPEPSYDEIKAFVLKNVSWYNLENIIRNPENPLQLAFESEYSKYAILNMDQLAEVIKRYFIDQESQGSFPCKF